MYQNEKLHSSSITLIKSRNHQLTLISVKAGFKRSGLKLQMSAETNGDEYIRVGIVQETSTYECLEVRRRVHTTGDENIRVPRGQETSTYDRR